MRKNVLAGLTCAAIAFGSGCASDAQPQEVSAALRALGVTHLDVVETDSQLVIDGRNVDGQVIAHLDAEIGYFLIDELNDPRFVTGRRMSLDLNGAKISHESEGLADLRLPAPPQSGVGAFLQDPTVAAALGDWGIAVERPRVNTDPSVLTLDKERAYTDCGPDEDPFLNVGYTNTCETSIFTGCATSLKVMQPDWIEWRCCNDSTGVQRACTTPNTETWCGMTGPGNGVTGCALCWNFGLSSNCWVGAEPGTSHGYGGGEVCAIRGCVPEGTGAGS